MGGTFGGGHFGGDIWPETERERQPEHNQDTPRYITNYQDTTWVGLGQTVWLVWWMRRNGPGGGGGLRNAINQSIHQPSARQPAAPRPRPHSAYAMVPTLDCLSALLPFILNIQDYYFKLFIVIYHLLSDRQVSLTFQSHLNRI